MGILKRGRLFFRKRGFVATVKQTADKCVRQLKKTPNACKERLVRKKHIKLLREVTVGKEVYIVIPCNDWALPLFQRPHQISKNLSSMENSVVLFISDQARYDNFCFTKKVTQSIYLFSLRMVSTLDKILADSKQVTVVMYWTRHYNLLSKFQYDKLVYEYVDELQLLPYYDEKMEITHRELLENADLTLATADELYKKAVPFAKKLILSPNAADYELFSTQRDCAINPMISELVKEYSCVLGYYGAFAFWFDYDLVLETARRNKDWLFILIGYDYDGTVSCIHKASLSNVLFIESRPYSELPSFVRGFDIQVIPFVIN